MPLLAICIFVVAALVMPPAQAAFSSQSGGSGLLFARTADIQDIGAVNLDLWMVLDTYAIPASFNRMTGIGLETSATFSLGDRIEAGFRLPYFYNYDSKDNGIPAMNGFAKLKIAGSRLRGYALSLTAFGTQFPADADRAIGSGSNQQGYEIHSSFYGPLVSTHITLGQGTLDLISVDSQTKTASYDSQVRNTVNLGVELHPSNVLNVTMEILATTGISDGDMNLLLAPGVRYAVGSDLFVNAGAAFGIPRGTAQPETRFIFGITWGFNKPERVVEESQISKQLGDLNLKVKELESRFNQINEVDMHLMRRDIQDLAIAKEALQQQAEALQQSQMRAQGQPAEQTPAAAPGVATEQAVIPVESPQAVVAPQPVVPAPVPVQQAAPVYSQQAPAVVQQPVQQAPQYPAQIIVQQPSYPQGYYPPQAAATAPQYLMPAPPVTSWQADQEPPRFADEMAFTLPDESPDEASCVRTPGLLSCLRVGVLNRSGIPELDQRFVRGLHNHGYRLARSNGSASRLAGAARIYYRRGYSEKAVALGHLLPGNQGVYESRDLPMGVDILLVLTRGSRTP